VQLLDCFAILVVVVLSYLLLKTQYQWHQLLLAIPLCLIGLAVLLVSDAIYNHKHDGTCVSVSVSKVLPAF